MREYLLLQIKWMNSYRRHLHLRGDKGKEKGAEMWVDNGIALFYSQHVAH